MAGTIVADTLQAASTSTLVIKNGVANTPPTIQDSAGTQIGTFCRAWVNFNGTGAVAIRADFNVTDITDNNVGDYTVNIDVDMPDANYATVVNTCSLTGWAANAYPMFIATSQSGISAPSPGSIRMAIRAATNNAFDPEYVSVAIFR